MGRVLALLSLFAAAACALGALVRSEIRLQGVSVFSPSGLQSACRAVFIVAQGNALGTQFVPGCAL